MARSAEDIYNSMVTEKQTFASLGGLLPLYNLGGITPDNPFSKYIQQVNSGSFVAIWILVLWVVANAQHSLEVLWDKLVIEMNGIAAQSISGTLGWYAAQMQAFQFGFALIWDSATYRYFYADTTSAAAVAARIIYKVSVQEVANQTFDGVVFKLAKNIGTTAAPILAPLDNSPGSELTSATTYVNRIKFAGVQTSVISLPADQLRLDINFYYDGTLDLTVFEPVVIAAIQAYLAAIPFTGVFEINDFIDAMQAIPGAIDPAVFINVAEAKAASDPGFTTITESYNPASGYFNLVAVGLTPGNTIINFIAK